jgi:nitroimidazol reductase NimA-like FMN-containing flavoprotein (pyridoxamine 5'-phosphate oxidase superfamily)
MRRGEREITDINEIEEIIQRAGVCHIALSDNNAPYIVAMNFGYENVKGPTLYFHCAHEGKKIDIIKRNNRVCFQFDVDHELVSADGACDFGMRYRSVVGSGKLHTVHDREEKADALRVIMKQYTGRVDHAFSDEAIGRTNVLRLEIEEMKGKKS